MSERTSGGATELRRAPHRWRVSGSWLAVLVAIVLVAVVAAALGPHNADFYQLWVYFDPQTGEEQYQNLRVDLFMALTSGFFWNQFVALFLGVFLASRLRGISRALVAAVPAGMLLAAVNLAVAWQVSADTRRRLDWWSENASATFPTDLLAEDGFQRVLAAGLAGYPLAAIAGVGLGTLVAPMLRASTVANTLLAVVATVTYGGFTMIVGGWVATADYEPVALLAGLALLPPAPVTPAVVRTALGDHGDAFTVAMLVGNVVWATVLIAAGRLVDARRA
ncbi:hypothetical protein [Plantactinospora sonchi]|uniref:ABC transporter permease n=1 Tax=Plantactinospora sonchi TaxID=1544735 RepID=A0ABU7RRM3_9ACTN